MVRPYQLTTHDGKTVDWMTHAFLLECEIKIGYRLTIVQGSYHKGTTASAGTHDGGGVVDLSPWDHVRKVRVVRDLGGFGWHRTAIPGLWAEHCHIGVIGNRKLAPAAARQVTSYKARRDGLAGNRHDPTYRPNPIPAYKWPGSRAALALEKKAAALLDPKPAPKPKPVPKPAPKPTPAPQPAAHLFVDYSFSRPDPAAIKAAGYRGVIRYLSTGTKGITTDEAAALHAAGLWIGLVWETTAKRAGEGIAAGVADAQAAEALAAELRVPNSVTIFYAVDFDATPEQVAPYFEGVKATATHPVGIYGGDKVINTGLAPWAWQTAAWSGGRVSAKANLLQRTTHSKSIAGSKATEWDENEIVRGGVPVWHKAGTKAAPTPKLQVRVVTANIRSDIVGEARRAAYEAIAAFGDILLTQEDHGVDSASLAPAGFATYQGGTKRCSVHWRTDLFTKSATRTLLLNLANGLTFPGARREAAVVVLKDNRNGQTVKATSAHLVPHADDDTKAGVITPLPRGKKAVRPAIAALIADAESHPEHVQIVGGDFNIDLKADLAIHDQGLVEQLNGAGFVSDVQTLGPNADTHGRDEYDQLYLNGGTWVAHDVLPNGPSDHHPKSAVLEYL